MSGKRRVIPALAGTGFLIVAGVFLFRGEYLVAGIFVFGAAMFLRQLIGRKSP